MRPRILEICILCTLFVLVKAFSPQDHQIFKLRDEITANDGTATTFYDVLGVSASATTEEITKALKKKSRTEHPDKVKHSWLASRSTGRPKKPGDKKRKGTSVVKGPTEREINTFMKTATERYTRLAVIADVLRSPELRQRYDHFLHYGFPLWKGTGYMYSRYRPGLGTVLLGLFLFGGGAAHFFALKITYTNQVKHLESYRNYARRAAFGDESTLGGIAGLAAPAEVPVTEDEPDPLANLNRKQRREYERQTKKEKTGPSKIAKQTPTPPSGPAVQRRRVTAQNGKVFLVEATGNVYLEEEDEDGEVQEFLLDPAEIPKPTIWDTAVARLPIWAYRKVADPFLKDAKPVPEVSATEESQEPIPSIIVPGKQAVTDMSSSQFSDNGFEIVDSTGIDQEIEAAGAKKRGKKGKKQ